MAFELTPDDIFDAETPLGSWTLGFLESRGIDFAFYAGIATEDPMGEASRFFSAQIGFSIEHESLGIDLAQEGNFLLSRGPGSFDFLLSRDGDFTFFADNPDNDLESLIPTPLPTLTGEPAFEILVDLSFDRGEGFGFILSLDPDSV
ncbi:MAG: hypothetical protein ACFBRM_03860 [Pikeienuella sp.]